ncbi:MAG: hypothetical protein ACOZCO_16435 [Bacteroidota bacterium]
MNFKLFFLLLIFVFSFNELSAQRHFNLFLSNGISVSTMKHDNTITDDFDMNPVVGFSGFLGQEIVLKDRFIFQNRTGFVQKGNWFNLDYADIYGNIFYSEKVTERINYFSEIITFGFDFLKNEKHNLSFHLGFRGDFYLDDLTTVTNSLNGKQSFKSYEESNKFIYGFSEMISYEYSLNRFQIGVETIFNQNINKIKNKISETSGADIQDYTGMVLLKFSYRLISK